LRLRRASHGRSYRGAGGGWGTAPSPCSGSSSHSDRSRSDPEDRVSRRLPRSAPPRPRRCRPQADGALAAERLPRHPARYVAVQRVAGLELEPRLVDLDREPAATEEDEDVRLLDGDRRAALRSRLAPEADDLHARAVGREALAADAAAEVATGEARRRRRPEHLRERQL